LLIIYKIFSQKAPKKGVFEAVELVESSFRPFASPPFSSSASLPFRLYLKLPIFAKNLKY